MPLQSALKAVETAMDADDPGGSVTERHTSFGYWWRYAYAGDGPDANLVGAIKMPRSSRSRRPNIGGRNE